MELSSNGRQGINGCSMEVSFLCKIMVTGMWSDVFYPEPRFYPLDFTLNPKFELNVWVGPWWWFHPRQSNTRSETARPGCFRDHRGLNGRTAPEYGQVWPHNGPEMPKTTRQGHTNNHKSDYHLSEVNFLTTGRPGNHNLMTSWIMTS